MPRGLRRPGRLAEHLLRRRLRAADLRAIAASAAARYTALVTLELARGLAKWTYAEAKREAEASVVRWEWATFTRHSLEPAYFEIHKHRPGNLLAGEPAPPTSGARAHGFDAEGRLCVERQQTEFPGRFYETFYARRDGGIARRHFGYGPEKEPINSAFFELEGERVVRIDTVYASGTHMAESFTYDATGRVASVERRGPGTIHDFRDLEWNTDHIARVYWRYPDGRRSLYYERAKREDTLARRRGRLTEGLVSAILRALERSPPDAEIYAVALWWCAAEYQNRFPPNVAIGTSTQRDEFLATDRERAKDFLWSPPEWCNELGVELDPELERICDAVSQDVWQNDLQEEADALVASVAAELGKRPLPVPAAKDVVAYAVRVDAAENAAHQLSRQLTPARRAAFEKSGML
jgi:hypothetical protein